MKEFKSKVALVTGGSSGIGRATALAFAQRGAKVVIGDINEQGAQETAKMIENLGGEALFVRTDVTNPKQVEEMVAKAIETFGRLDYACNNAGIGGASAPAADYAYDDWKGVIDVNLIGVWLCMKYEIPEMLKAGGGAIVNVSSILGQVGFANASAYVAAKHGVLGLTKTAAAEYAPQGVRINAVCPAFIETPMLEKAGILGNEDFEKMIISLHPINRMGTPEEVAEAIVWLCSDGASFVVGESMLVDGGYVAR
jgi:NAD(P)-dependent dehydrogenase (short-subunit alcohol dehydrogenase family)